MGRNNLILITAATVFIIFSLSLYSRPSYYVNSDHTINIELEHDTRKTVKQKVHEKPRLKAKPKLKQILYWNELYGSKNYGFCCGRGPYKRNKCANDACFTSKERTEDLSVFDAIVFHGRNLNKNDLPAIRLLLPYFLITHNIYSISDILISTTYFLFKNHQPTLAISTYQTGTDIST